MLSRERGLRPVPGTLCSLTPIEAGAQHAQATLAVAGAAVLVCADDRVRDLTSAAVAGPGTPG